MAEKQSDHRMALEIKVIHSNLAKSYLGMAAGVSIALYGLYIAKEIAVNGNPATAGIVAALDLGGLVWVAVSNAKAQKKEREDKKHLQPHPLPHASKSYDWVRGDIERVSAAFFQIDNGV